MKKEKNRKVLYEHLIKLKKEEILEKLYEIEKELSKIYVAESYLGGQRIFITAEPNGFSGQNPFFIVNFPYISKLMEEKNKEEQNKEKKINNNKK